jgi:peptidoglycan/xylan/chitin deacetylase (PgdA/CDA1 family)
VFNRRRRQGGPALALTFDDGPSEWTPAILDLLGAHGACATFFVLGAAVAGREEILRRAVAEGHELGNHTFDHPDPTSLTESELRAELARTAGAVEEAAGVAVSLVRPPFCADGDRVARVAAAAGLGRTILRSIDPADWRNPDAEQIAAEVLAEAAPGEIVCLHDGIAPRNRGVSTRDHTVTAVRLLLPALRERGFELVTVSDLLA